jgi:formiminoglutamase
LISCTEPRKFDYILPPELIRRSIREDRFEKRVANWLHPWDGREKIDAALLMVPFSKAAQRGDNGSSGAPNAIRLVLPGYTTYSTDFDVDIASLKVRDAGDVRMHMTDILQCHRNMEEAVVEFYQAASETLLISIGGDHSITCPLVQGYCRSHPREKVGIVHFDAHHDVRNFEDGGPTNGTPFRGIIEGPANVEGRNIVQIGIHGFAGSSYYKRWCEDQGVTIVSAREVRRRGMADVIAEACKIAADKTDALYVSFDIDVMAAAYAPGTGYATPEGLDPWDVLEAMFVLGQDPRVKAMDYVCMDPLRDVRDVTAKMGASVILTFLGGYLIRKTGGRGY